MNSKQRKTLEAIFAKVILRNIRWNNFESMFLGLGFTMIEGDGSKVSFERDAVELLAKLGGYVCPRPSAASGWIW